MKLDLDRLAVESFSPAAEDETKAGTVHGQQISLNCSGQASCDSCTYNGDGSCSGDHNCLCQVTFPC